MFRKALSLTHVLQKKYEIWTECKDFWVTWIRVLSLPPCTRWCFWLLGTCRNTIVQTISPFYFNMLWDIVRGRPGSKHWQIASFFHQLNCYRLQLYSSGYMTTCYSLDSSHFNSSDSVIQWLQDFDQNQDRSDLLTGRLVLLIFLCFCMFFIFSVGVDGWSTKK